jgi:hypothetical protein
MTITHPELRPHFWRTIFDCMRNNPSALKPVTVFASIYLDIGQSNRHVTSAMKARWKQSIEASGYRMQGQHVLW